MRHSALIPSQSPFSLLLLLGLEPMQAQTEQQVPTSFLRPPLGLLGFTLGLRGFSDTNMLVSTTQKSHVRGITQHEDQTRGGLRCGGI